MGTGWRRAFCTTIPRETERENRSPRRCKKPASSSSSNPCTPRLKCSTVAEAAAQANAEETPRLRCKTSSVVSSTSSAAATPKSTKSPRLPFFASLSTPSSPRSPLKLSLFRNSFKFRLQSNSCGVCSSSVKTGQGTAIYTAECSHVFHFPCITDHVRNRRALVCPVCNATWKDVPLLAVHKDLHVDNPQADVIPRTDSKNVEDKKVTFEASPRTVKYVKKEMTSTPKLVESRSYDDDEPLLSPTAGAKFVPIPEADENVEEEDSREGSEQEEEFQGFFVNRSQFSDDIPLDNFRKTRNVEVRILPESAVVSVGRSQETYVVVVRVKAPPPPPIGRGNPPHRAPVDLVTVLDLSGSMTGAKLQMLKRAVRLVISSLGSADRLSIVAFSATPKRLLPLRRMTAQGQQSARRIVDRLVCGQGSSVSDALRKAAKVLEDRRERNTVASIMLLSDGQSERVSSGNQNHHQLARHASSTHLAHIEIPVLPSGFGIKRGYSHEPAEDAFAKFVGGLLNVVVQDLRIQLGVSSSSAPAEIAAIYTLNGCPAVVGAGAIRLGDLYAEEEKEYLVELKVPTSSSGSRHVISVRSCYKDPTTQEIVYCRDRTLLVPRPHAVRSSSPKIERLRSLFVTTRAIAESRRLVDHGDLTSADQMLATARSLLLQLGSSSDSGEEYVRAVDAELAEIYWRRQSGQERERLVQRGIVDEYGEPLTPTSAWRAAEQLAKVALMKKSMSKVSDLHGFENARF